MAANQVNGSTPATPSSPSRRSLKDFTIGILTSGGDSCGMNAAVRSVTRVGTYHGARVFHIREGYQGMHDDDGSGTFIVEATWNSVSGIIHRGGTTIGSARCKEFRTPEGRYKAATNLAKKGINTLVVIGGDGSLTGANILSQEWPTFLQRMIAESVISGEQAARVAKLRIAGIVGSIDNDFCGTDMTLGTDSALHRIQEDIDSVLTTAESHQRVFILEIMGRNCGYLPLVAGITSEASKIFIPEDPPEDGWQQELCEKLRRERDLGCRTNIILVSEGAIDRKGNKITAGDVKAAVESTGFDTRVTIPGHKQRGGVPSAFDRNLGSRMANAIEEGFFDDSMQAFVITLEGNQIIRKPLMKCVEDTQAVAKAMKELKFDEAVKLRGKSFERNLETYKMLSQLKPELMRKSAEVRGRTVAVICIGAPCCGMNAAVRSFVRNMILEGHRVLKVCSGIDGLLHGDISELKWTEVRGFNSEAGTIIGSRRTLASDSNMDKVAKIFAEKDVNGLLMIGGFEAYQCALNLYKARAKFDVFKMPIAVIPATISNNVPGTDFSLGADTAVNAITTVCDTLRASAQGTRNRVFIVKTMGGYCGYLATMAGLAGGADAAYIHEESYNVNDLVRDSQHMIEKMGQGISRGLILVNENANINLDAEFIYKVHREHARTAYSVRLQDPGHTQQGLSPSPFDRNLGTKMAAKAAIWFNELYLNLGEDIAKYNTPGTAFLIGNVGQRYVKTPLAELEPQTDFTLRRAKNQWYLRLRPLLRILAKHEVDE